jgi:HPt (histidine-containing phosphotransfer) domain-containing protein
MDPELLPVVRSWLTDLAGQLDEAEQALDRGDAERAARVGHSIKGSGGTLGLPEFTSPGAALEHAGRAGDGPGVQHSIAVLRDLQAAALTRLAA